MSNSAKTESDHTANFCGQLKKFNCHVIRLTGGSVRGADGIRVTTELGIPDRYICHRRWSGFVEFKMLPNGKVQGIQADHLQQLNTRQPASAFICWIPPGAVNSALGQWSLQWWNQQSAQWIAIPFDGSAKGFLDLVEKIRRAEINVANAMES
jgi:hypothetical protein